MALSFDHATKRLYVPQAEAAPVLVQALVNAIREEEASERGITYDQIADATGKEALGGAVLTGITLSLRSTWEIEFEAGAYQATITGGNLADALDRVYNTGSPQVLVQSSSASTLVETGVSGLTTEEAAKLDLLQSPMPANVVKVNGVPIAGTGVPGTDPWRPA